MPEEEGEEGEEGETRQYKITQQQEDNREKQLQLKQIFADRILRDHLHRLQDSIPLTSHLDLLYSPY